MEKFKIKKGGQGPSTNGTADRRQSDWSDEPEDEPTEADRKIDKRLKELNRRHNKGPISRSINFNAGIMERKIPEATQLIGKVRKALLADSRNRIARNRDSGEIDMRKLHQIAQLTDVNTVYKRTTRGKKLDACVQIYIDESGSMNDDVIVKGKKFICMPYAAAAAACLSKAMDQLRVPHQLIYFTSRISIGKDWKGKWQNAGLEHARPCQGTYAPNALEKGLPLMAHRREQRKIAIVITDGDMSTNDKFWEPNGKWAKLRREGYEIYAIGLMTRVLTSNPKNPTHEWCRSIGIGEIINHYYQYSDYKNGLPPRYQTVGINGGIDNVQPDTMIPQLAKHLVEVFTEGREVIR